MRSFSNKAKASFRLLRIGRGDGLLYREGDRSMRINSEPLTGEHELVVELDSIRSWNPPHAHVPVTDDDKQRIESNLRASLSSFRVLWEHEPGRWFSPDDPENPARKS